MTPLIYWAISCSSPLGQQSYRSYRVGEGLYEDSMTSLVPFVMAHSLGTSDLANDYFLCVMLNTTCMLTFQLNVYRYIWYFVDNRPVKEHVKVSVNALKSLLFTEHSFWSSIVFYWHSMGSFLCLLRFLSLFPITYGSKYAENCHMFLAW